MSPWMCTGRFQTSFIKGFKNGLTVFKLWVRIQVILSLTHTQLDLLKKKGYLTVPHVDHNQLDDPLPYTITCTNHYTEILIINFEIAETLYHINHMYQSPYRNIDVFNLNSCDLHRYSFVSFLSILCFFLFCVPV